MHIVKLFDHMLQAHHSWFMSPNIVTKFYGEPRRWNVKYKNCAKIWRFSTDIAVFLGNGTR